MPWPRNEPRSTQILRPRTLSPREKVDFNLHWRSYLGLHHLSNRNRRIPLVSQYSWNLHLQDTFDPRRKKASVGNSDDAAVSSLFWPTASCGSLGSCWSIIHNSSYPSEIILNSPKAHLKLSEIQLNPSSITLNSILMHDSCNPKSNLINHSLMFPSTFGGGSSISARWCPPVTSCAPQWCLLVYEP